MGEKIQCITLNCAHSKEAYSKEVNSLKREEDLAFFLFRIMLPMTIGFMINGYFFISFAKERISSRK